MGLGLLAENGRRREEVRRRSGSAEGLLHQNLSVRAPVLMIGKHFVYCTSHEKRFVCEDNERGGSDECYEV